MLGSCGSGVLSASWGQNEFNKENLQKIIFSPDKPCFCLFLSFSFIAGLWIKDSVSCSLIFVLFWSVFISCVNRVVSSFSQSLLADEDWALFLTDDQQTEMMAGSLISRHVGSLNSVWLSDTSSSLAEFLSAGCIFHHLSLWWLFCLSFSSLINKVLCCSVASLTGLHLNVAGLQLLLLQHVHMFKYKDFITKTQSEAVAAPRLFWLFRKHMKLHRLFHVSPLHPQCDFFFSQKCVELSGLIKLDLSPSSRPDFINHVIDYPAGTEAAWSMTSLCFYVYSVTEFGPHVNTSSGQSSTALI